MRKLWHKTLVFFGFRQERWDIDAVEPFPPIHANDIISIPLTKLVPTNTTFERLDQMQTIQEVKKFDAVDKPSQAQEFVTYIKTKHFVPDLSNPVLAKKLHVVRFMYEWNDQGFYKLVFAYFEDQSSWERGIVK